MAVRIRMKKFGRRHRPFYRICAVDSRRPRDGRVLEELGTYDPLVPESDARAILKADRIDYWLGVGAQPSDKVKVLIRKYGTDGTHADQQREAIDRLAQSRRRVVAAPPPKPKQEHHEEQPAEAPAEAATDTAVAEPPPEPSAEEQQDQE